MPWEGPGAGYGIVGEAIGATRSDQVRFGGGVFTVARGHTQGLIANLAARYGLVRVIQYGGTTKCVEACWSAAPETTTMCQCSCAGDNHGSGGPHGRIVSSGGSAGALSVAHRGPREYDVHG